MKCLVFITSILLNFSLVAGNSYAYMEKDEFLEDISFQSNIDLAQINPQLIEAGVFHLTNENRLKKNKNALTYNEALSFAAYTHSEQMQTFRFFDHVNKRNKSLSSLEKRAEYAAYRNYQSLAENIFYGYIDARNPGTYEELCSFIVKSFIASKGHRDNLLAKDLKEMGCGIYFETKLKDGYWYFYFTQDFGTQIM